MVIINNKIQLKYNKILLKFTFLYKIMHFINDIYCALKLRNTLKEKKKNILIKKDNLPQFHIQENKN